MLSKKIATAARRRAIDGRNTYGLYYFACIVRIVELFIPIIVAWVFIWLLAIMLGVAK